MLSPNPRSTASLSGHPIHAMLVPISIVCFVATLVTDIVYWRTATMLWADMSAWLLVIGLIVSVFAASTGLIDFFGDRRIRELRSAWIHGLGNTAALILSVINAFIHTRDGYTSVVPTGLILSALVVLILLVTGWNGWTMVYRHGVGVRRADRPSLTSSPDGSKLYAGVGSNLEVDSQGGLLIADDTGNSVWRVSAASP